MRNESSKLSNDLKSMKKDKMEMNANLRYWKDMLNLRNGDMEKLEKRIENMKDVEASLREKWITSKVDLEQRLREVENSRVLIVSSSRFIIIT